LSGFVFVSVSSVAGARPGIVEPSEGFMATLHYAAGGSASDVATAGFNLVDVQYLAQVNALPDGMKGLVWLGQGGGVTQSFIDQVTPFLNNSKVFGFFLVDEPDPTGKYHTKVSAADLKAESDWIHTHFPGAKTFITLMDMGPFSSPDFSNTYNPANTGIDYYGIDPYPVRSGSSIDYSYIDRSVAAAVKAGIPVGQIVPVYQTFGGGGWTTNTGGSYVMPTTSQMQTMADHWDKLVPSPAFDFAYAWGSQNGDTALGSSSALKAFFLQHNTDAGTGTGTATGAGTAAGSSTGTGTGTGTGASTGSGSGSGPASDAPSPGILYGTKANDVFHGAGGHTMIGYGGNDTYYVDDTRDVVVEAKGGGIDKVIASVNFTLSAGSAVESLSTKSPSATTAINLTGNELGQTLQGNAGANVITGGSGADILTGNGGKDVFVFNTALGAGNVDRITDFRVGQDKIGLDHTVFSALQPGNLAADAFSIGAARDHGDHIIYNSSTGALYYDGDGHGGASAIQFATVSPHLSFTASSFFVT
jgi:serralysin